MRPRKGQSAVEYMMTYGWAILVILVVGVVLWQIGLPPKPPSTSIKEGFTQVTPLDWSLMENGTLIVVVQNDAGTIVNLRRLQTGANLVVGGAGECAGLDSEVPFDESFRPGSTTRLTFYDCNLESGMTLGEYYRANLTIGYYNPSSKLEHKSNGIIGGPLG